MNGFTWHVGVEISPGNLLARNTNSARPLAVLSQSAELPGPVNASKFPNELQPTIGWSGKASGSTSTHRSNASCSACTCCLHEPEVGTTNPNLHSKLVRYSVVAVELAVVVTVVAVSVAVVDAEFEMVDVTVVEPVKVMLDEAVELTVDTAHCASLPAAYSVSASFKYPTMRPHSPL